MRGGRAVQLRGRARRVPAPRARHAVRPCGSDDERGHSAAPQPAAPGAHGLRPAHAQRGTVPAGAGRPDPPAHREAVRGAVVPACRPHARDRRRRARDPRRVGARQPAGLPRRVHPTHLHAPDVRSGPQPVWAPGGLYGGARPTHDPYRRRGGRRPAGHAVQHRTPLPGAHPARGRGRAATRRTFPRAVRHLPAGGGCDGTHCGRAGACPPRSAVAARLLRLNAGVPPRPGRARLGRDATPAERVDQSGRDRRDERAHHRRNGGRAVVWRAPEECADQIIARFGDHAGRVCCYFPGYDVADAHIADLAAAVAA